MVLTEMQFISLLLKPDENLHLDRFKVCVNSKN